MDLRNVRVVERCQHLRLAFEPREAIGVVGDGRQEHFERDIAMELPVVRPVDFAHPSASQVGADLVRAKGSADGENHGVSELCALSLTIKGGREPRTIAADVDGAQIQLGQAADRVRSPRVVT